MRFMLLIFLWVNASYTFAETLENRLTSFAALQSSQAKFVETWIADYLEEPMVTKGKLFYKAKGQLKKIIEQPELIEQVITGNQLLITRDGEQRSLILDDEPVLAAGIYALLSVLEGNKNSLQKRFQTRFEGRANKWTLTLLPLNKQVAQKIESITLQGQINQIKRVCIEYVNGDESLTEIFHGE